MLAVFLLASQWIFPSGLGFRSLACARTIEIFQSAKLRRCCQNPSRALRKPSACATHRPVPECSEGGAPTAPPAKVRKRTSGKTREEEPATDRSSIAFRIYHFPAIVCRSARRVFQTRELFARPQ